MPFPGLNRAQVQTLIDASVSAYYTISEIDTLLSGKSSTGHTHDDRYYTETEIDALLSGFGGDHNHDDRYYTQAEVDTLLLGKASTSHTHDYSSVYAALVHNHDDRYYTDSEVDAAFAALSGVYAPSSHNHSASAITSGTLDASRLPDLSAVYSVVGHNHDLVYAALSHDHDSRYFTESEVTALLAGKSDTTHNHDLAYAALSHTHDDRYYTESEVDTLLSGKASSTHSHAASDITSGTLANARVNWAAPDALGSGTPAAVSATTLTGTITDTNATSVVNNIDLAHAVSSGTPSTAFGLGLRFRGHSATPGNGLRDMGRFRYDWGVNAVDASRRSRAVISVVEAGTERDQLIVTGTYTRFNHNGQSPVAYFQFEEGPADGRQRLIHFSDTASANIIQARGGVKAVLLGPASGSAYSLSSYGMTGNIYMSDQATVIPAPIFGTLPPNAGTHKSLFISTPETQPFVAGTWTKTDIVDLVTFSNVSNTWGGTRPSLRHTALEHIFRIDTGTGQNNPGTEVMRVRSAGTVAIGVPPTPTSSSLHVHQANAQTSTAITALTVSGESTSTATAGFGVGILFQGESSTTVDRWMGRHRYEWTTVTDATRTSKAVISVISSVSEVDALTVTATGTSAPALITTGTGGNGYLELFQQNGAVSAPTTALRVYADSNNYLSWRRPSGIAATLDTSALTLDRTFALPNVSDTIVTLTATQTLTNKTLTSPAISGGTINSATIGAVTPAGGTFSSVTVAGSTSLTTTVSPVLTVGHNTSGTPAAGYGLSIPLQLESSTTTSQDAAVIEAVWNDATHASRKADLVLSAYDTSKREGMRVRGAGSAAALGFYGSTPVTKPSVTGSRSANAALASILSQLAALGLITDSTTEGTASTDSTPAGAIMEYAGSSAPTGWLLCYGQAVSRTTYAALFAALSTTYGAGDGSTTFNVPDLRGRSPLGLDNMGGSSANRVTATAADSLGGSGGAETHTLTTTEMPSHRHTLNSNSSGAVGNRLDYGNGLAAGATHYGYVDLDVAARQYLSNTGGDGAHNNMQPYLALSYIIKT